MRNRRFFFFPLLLTLLLFSTGLAAQQPTLTERQQKHEARTAQAADELRLSEFQTTRDRLFEAIAEQDAASAEVLKTDLLALIQQQLKQSATPRLSEIKEALTDFTFAFDGPAVSQLQHHLGLINEFGALLEAEVKPAGE